MSNIALIQTPGWSKEDQHELGEAIEEASPPDVTFIITGDQAEFMNEEDFVGHLESLAEVAGYELVEDA